MSESGYFWAKNLMNVSTIKQYKLQHVICMVRPKISAFGGFTAWL